ncbi:class I SAM-dependent methyltransferase [bacterium]|nr:class I SAM-dependent methyltransferase [bacterium]
MTQRKPTADAGTSGTEWFQDWFDDDYLALYQHRDSTEARTFLRHLRTQVGDPDALGVVDLACGAGRHSEILAGEFGWRVTGLDLSMPLLRRAVANQSVAKRTGPRYVRGDLRNLPFADGTFPLALNVFTSFGYFGDDDEHRQALGEMYRVLRPGGTLVLDLMNPTVAVASLVAEDETDTERWHVHQRRRYVAASKRIEKTIDLTARDGSARQVRESVRLFGPDELDEMLKATRLNPVARWGGYEASTFDPETSKRLITFAERA